MAPDLKRDYFNDLAPRWDDLPAMPDAAEKIARFVRRAVPDQAGWVLDVGCGTGVLLAHIPPREGRRLVELDAAERMLAENRRKRAAAGVGHVCADARRLPFPPETFDTVLCFGVLPHLAPLENALAALLATVKPNGTLAAGHLMGSENLNAFHASLGGPVAEDRLPAAGELAGLLGSLGAETIAAEEDPGWYLVRVRKR